MVKAKEQKAAVVAAPTVVKAGKAAPGLIKVLKGDAKLRGARQAWYETLRKYDGKPAAEFLVACAEKPPSLPKSGVAEKPQGWLSWFVRSGIAQVAVQQDSK